jgi:hypothetical protein
MLPCLVLSSSLPSLSWTPLLPPQCHGSILLHRDLALDPTVPYSTCPPACQGLLKVHISVYFICFKYFIGMLQVFHIDVAKVDRNVAMTIHVCCKRLFQMFHLFFQTYVASVFIGMLYIFSRKCCKCFFWMLYMFLMAFQVFSVFSKCFRRMFQVCYLSLDVCCKCSIWMFQK